MVPSARWRLRHGVASVTGFAREFGGDEGGAVLISRRANQGVAIKSKARTGTCTGFQAIMSKPAQSSNTQGWCLTLRRRSLGWPYPQAQPTGWPCPQVPPTGSLCPQAQPTGLLCLQALPTGWPYPQALPTGWPYPQAQPTGWPYPQVQPTGWPYPQALPTGWPYHRVWPTGWHDLPTLP